MPTEADSKRKHKHTKNCHVLTCQDSHNHYALYKIAHILYNPIIPYKRFVCLL